MDATLKYDDLSSFRGDMQKSFKDTVIAYILSPFLTLPLTLILAMMLIVSANYTAGAILFPVLFLMFMYRNIGLLYLTAAFCLAFYGYILQNSGALPETLAPYPYFMIAILGATVFMHAGLSAYSLNKPFLPNRKPEVLEDFEEIPRQAKHKEKVSIREAMFLNTIINIVHHGTGSIDSLASTNAGRLREQISSSHEILFTSQELSEFFENVDKKVAIIKNMSEKAIESAMLGQKMALNTEDEIKTVLNTMQTTTDLIRNLSMSTNKIATIIDGVENVADQTNLLALNATIESARAGSRGHSFAVVAEEIGKLAETTQRSTRQVIGMINSIRTSTEATMDMLPQELQQANAIINHSEKVHDLLNAVLGDVEGLTDRVHELAINSKQQSRRSTEIHNYVESIARFVSDNADGVKTIFNDTDNLVEQAHSLAIVNERLRFEDRVENPLEQIKDLGVEFLRQVEQSFEEEIEKKHITEEELFNRTYTQFGGFNPPKYHASYDRFTDEFIGPIQENFLEKDGRIDYLVLIDSQGYVPTHNKKYCQIQTYTYEDQLKYNRTKRIYNDPIGLRAAQNTEPYLLQMYKKDTGEFLNDLSIPFIFRGRHWGAVRIGYVF